MPVINNTSNYAEIYYKQSFLARTKKFNLVKPLLYVGGLKLNFVDLFPRDLSIYIFIISELIIIPTAKVVSSTSIKKMITDITFNCDTYITFELPKFKDIVDKFKRGKGIIITP